MSPNLHPTVPMAVTDKTSEEDKLNDAPQEAEMETFPAAGIAAAVVFGLFLLLAVAFLLYKVYRRKCSSQSKYERIGKDSKLPTPMLKIEGKGPIQPKLDLKSVPFAVPQSTPTREDFRMSTLSNQERRDSLGSAPITSNLNGSIVASDSESNSPVATPSRRSSVTEIPGAYVLGEINPDLYKIHDDDDDVDTYYPEDHMGRIWFAVEYEHESERLVVTLVKARNLPSRVLGSVNQCDPLVKIFLLPDERRHLQSKLRRKTTNPKFDESFVFQVTYKALLQRTLRLTLCDVDRSKRHRVLGHVLLPLRDVDFDNNEKVIMWRDLEKDVTETVSEKGDIQFSLSYNEDLDRLTVTIINAKGLPKLDNNPFVDSYVKICLLHVSKVIKTKKTSIIKRSCDPAFNESFILKVSSEQMDTTSLSIAVMKHAPGVKGDKQIGRVVVGPFMYARGKELEHWNDMLSAQKEQVTHWHSLT
ncbi:synaptotagmin-15-like [Saccoglossus kowalevskii]|uniref:Synaptotagmin-15-like n=1 Tax=Saccoglossus kowalevskii TaxID=10224 RepID=A0ABM0M208_SACKO|nr:PREDICTED: synaptotagmin-15-like [Saccoglossus kowalevskii]